MAEARNSGVTQILQPGKSKVHDQRLAAMEEIEVPGTWFLLGMATATCGVVAIQVISFSIHWWMGVLSVLMTFFLAVVACRATGETDITPIGAMGKITQLFYGAIAPAKITTNLMTACVTAGAAASSADLLTDLKSGYLLGANPRKQFLAQFVGIFFGTLAIIPAWYAMVPDKAKLEAFNPPATNMWKAVADLLTQGIQMLPQSAIVAIVIGSCLGVLLPVIEYWAPRSRSCLPSAMGLGLAWVIPFQNSLSFAMGAVITVIWTRLHAGTANTFNVPIASGLVAGESLVAALIAIACTVVGLVAAR